VPQQLRLRHYCHTPPLPRCFHRPFLAGCPLRNGGARAPCARVSPSPSGSATSPSLATDADSAPAHTPCSSLSFGQPSPGLSFAAASLTPGSTPRLGSGALKLEEQEVPYSHVTGAPAHKQLRDGSAELLSLPPPSPPVSFGSPRATGPAERAVAVAAAVAAARRPCGAAYGLPPVELSPDGFQFAADGHLLPGASPTMALCGLGTKGAQERTLESVGASHTLRPFQLAEAPDQLPFRCWLIKMADYRMPLAPYSS
jgi:hypothetical protein